jgi:hypothetical protein
MKRITSYSLLFLLVLISCNNQKQESKPEGDSPKANSEQKILENTKIHYEAWNKIDTNLMKTVTIEKITRYANGKLASGDQTGLAATMIFFKTAIPDFSLTPGDIIIKDDKSYTKWIVKGTNTGMFGKNPPSGKSSETNGFTILTFNGEGKVTQEEAYFDQLSYLEAWGYTVTPPKTK